MFFLGAALGSFVLVIANRYNTGLSPFRGRSVCFSCNTTLENRDLWPVFSFIFLKGRCRYCRSQIPKTAFFVEITMGVLSILAALRSGFLVSDFSSIIINSYFIIHFFQYLLLTSVFAVILLISLYDLKHFIIPDPFLISLLIFSLIFLFVSDLSIFQSLNLSFIPLNLLAGLVLALPFFMIFLFSKGAWFGFGDVKYIGVLGFLLGFAVGLSAVILAFWVGAVFSLLALSIKKVIPRLNLPLLKNNLTIKSEIPFGPFLSLGAIASFLFDLDLFGIYEFFVF